MHWTDTLARLQYPRHASVIDDLACSGCGYNLRGARVRGLCPECGAPVERSISMFSDPTRTAAAFRGLGKSYLGLLAVLIGCMPHGSMPALLILTGAAAFRLHAAFELRFKTSLHLQPRLERLLQVLLIVVAADIAMLGVAMLSIGLGLQQSTSATVRSMAIVAGGGWMLTTLIGMGIAGVIGRAVADRLGYEAFRREFTAQLCVLSLPALMIPLGLLGLVASSQTGGPGAAGVMLLGVGVGLCLLTSVFTMVALHHLGNIVELDGGEDVDVVDAQRGPQPRPLPTARDLPDVPLT